MTLNDWLEKTFPGLRNTSYARTSDPARYNCIAYSADDKNRWWWPDGKNYWPPGLPCTPTIEAFEALYGSLGYVMASDAELEEGVEKVALFAKGAVPTHAARQLRTGMWTSKLGRNVDIAHELVGLEGREYGKVALIFQRPRS